MPLTFALPLYLTDFLKCRIRPESQKDSQNCGRKKFGGPAFTLPALSITMVDYSLRTGHRPHADRNPTRGRYLPAKSHAAPKVKKALRLTEALKACSFLVFGLSPALVNGELKAGCGLTGRWRHRLLRELTGHRKLAFHVPAMACLCAGVRSFTT